MKKNWTAFPLENVHFPPCHVDPRPKQEKSRKKMISVEAGSVIKHETINHIMPIIEKVRNINQSLVFKVNSKIQ